MQGRMQVRRVVSREERQEERGRRSEAGGAKAALRIHCEKREDTEVGDCCEEEYNRSAGSRTSFTMCVFRCVFRCVTRC